MVDCSLSRLNQGSLYHLTGVLQLHVNESRSVADQRGSTVCVLVTILTGIYFGLVIVDFVCLFICLFELNAVFNIISVLSRR